MILFLPVEVYRIYRPAEDFLRVLLFQGKFANLVESPKPPGNSEFS
jgi:hypothetical protein